MTTPPKFFLKLFRAYCRPDLHAYIEGDLLEDYKHRLKAKGKRQADFRFALDVLFLFRPGIIRSKRKSYTLNQSDMLANYIKIALRVLRRNMGYSFINISGLAVGMASTILILLWVQHEVSYDRFYTNAHRIYKMYSRDQSNGRTTVWQTTPALMGPELKQSYGEVEDMSRYRQVFFLVKAGEERYNDGGAFVDASFLHLFDFPLLAGNRNALENDFGIVLTQELAIRLFGKTDCVGEPVALEGRDNFTVTGVLKTLPRNTEFQFGYLIPWKYMTRLGWDRFDDWTQTNAITFAMLKEGTSPIGFQSKVIKEIQRHVDKGDGSTREVLAHPLKKVHLYSRAENGQLVRGRIESVRLFLVIAGLIILIACINFMNLSTAQSEKRAREVGVRKVAGAHRSSLVLQFICESVVLVFIAFIVALVLVQLSLNAFSLIVKTPLFLDFTNPMYWLVALALIVVTGLLAGSYPAFFLSSSRPLRVLKGAFKNANGLITPRKVLVVMQFTFAVVLTISAIVVQRQIRYAMNRDTGYSRSEIAFNFTQGEIPRRYEAIREELLNSGAVVSMTRTFCPITQIWDVNNSYTWQGSTEDDKTINFLQFGSDADFTKTFGATILAGRDIDIRTYASDTAAMLLNEAAVEMMRLKDPVGEIIKDENGRTFHVVGVVKNFIVGSPYQEVGPMMVKGWDDRYGAVHFKLNSANGMSVALSKAEKIFRKYNPDYPFEANFVDELYDRKFGTEKQTGALATLFAALAVIISCLGLFGLVAFMAQNKTKEIGIRKVLGATTASIATLISKEFIRLVIVAIVIASPIAYLLVKNWLQSFSYRVPVEISVFVITAAAAVLVALLTVSVQAFKAAKANPAASLKND